MGVLAGFGQFFLLPSTMRVYDQPWATDGTHSHPPGELQELQVVGVKPPLPPPPAVPPAPPADPAVPPVPHDESPTPVPPVPAPASVGVSPSASARLKHAGTTAPAVTHAMAQPRMDRALGELGSWPRATMLDATLRPNGGQ